jgi:hypothetical protein
MKRQFINAAKQFWDSGQALKAGEILYEHLRPQQRPLWAVEVLSHCCQLFPPVPAVENVRTIALATERWPEAYNAFGVIRELGLSSQSQPPLMQEFLSLAELVAKVTYNATGHSAPFDHNAGWKLVKALHGICELHNCSKFTVQSWHIVSCEDFSDDRPTVA